MGEAILVTDPSSFRDIDPLGLLSLVFTQILLFIIKKVNPQALRHYSDSDPSSGSEDSEDREKEKNEETNTVDESKTQKPCGEYLKRWELWSVVALSPLRPDPALHSAVKSNVC